MIVCTQCSNAFPSIKQRELHVRDKHQMIVRFKHQDRYITFYRSAINQTFSCLYENGNGCGQESFPTPKSLVRHLKKCLPIAIIPTTTTTTITTTTTTTLAQFNLFIDQDLNVIICQICACGIVPQFLKSHMKKKHNITNSIQITNLLLTSPDDPQLRISSRNTPIPGIKLYNGGWQCNECNFCCHKKSSIRTHFREKHYDLRKSFTLKIRPVPNVQTIFRGSFKSFFPIITNHISSPSPLTTIAIREDMARIITNLQQQHHHLNDYRNISHWISLLQWNKLVESTLCTRAALRELCALPRHDSILESQISQISHQFICTANTNIHEKSNFTIRKRIGDASAWGALSDESSIRSYAIMLSRLFCFLFRSTNILYQDLKSELLILETMIINDNDNDNDIIMKQFHVTLLAIWCHEFSFNQFATWNDFVYRFVCFASIKEDNSFATPREITPIVARLQFCARAAIHEEILTINDPDGITRKTKLNELLFYLQEGEFTSFNNLIEISNLVTAVAHEQPAPTQMTWVHTSNYKAMIINGINISIDTISKVIKHELAIVKDTLTRDLLYGYCNNSDINCSNIRDNVGILTPGYSFREEYHDNIRLRDFCFDFVEYLQPRMSIYGDWNRARIEEWLGKHNEIIESFFMLIHLSSGMPARGTELETYKIANTDLDQRSVYLSMDTIMLVGRYWKGRVKAGHDRIVSRYLPKVIAELLVKYIIFIKPVHEYFCKKFTYGNSEDAGENYLFASFGQRLEAKDLLLIFKKRFLCAAGVNLGFADYRHAAQGFANELIYKSIESSSLNVILDHQAAHSTPTASRYYARSKNEDHPAIDRDAGYDFFRASIAWHNLIDMPWDTSSSSGSSGDGNIITPASRTINNTSVNNYNTTIVVSSSSSSSKGKRLQSNSSSNDIDSLCNKLLTEGLNKFYATDNSAKFKSLEQYRATLLIFERKHDVLAIMPTGAGKTLTFLLPAYIENNITIVIEPLIVLVDEMIDRCERKGINCIVWTNDIITIMNLGIIVCSVENAASHAFFLFVQSHITRISRIVLDECHLVITWSEFRPEFKRLLHLRTLDVPFVMLTATLPIKMERPLRIALAVDPIIIRCTTARPEIQYHVIRNINIRFDRLIDADADSCSRAIVYCRSKKKAQELYELYQNISALYHADIPNKKETRLQWINGTKKIMIATSAFSLGVDYPHVRRVIHMGSPRTIIEYAQESGRAGRDGKHATAIIILDNNSNKCDDKAMKSFMTTNTTCRRRILHYIII